MPIAEAHEWEVFWSRKKASSAVSWSKRRILAVVDQYAKSGLRILDAGCGSGFFSGYFCERGLETTALDYSQEALNLTEKLTGKRARLLKADLLKDDLENQGQKFDLIFSDGLLEHFQLEEQRTIVRNLTAVLAPAGRILTFVPNRWSPWQLIRPFFMPGICEDPFCLPQLCSLHSGAGLKIIVSGGVNVFPFSFSPDRLLAAKFGMLLYCVAQKKQLSG